MLLPLSRMGIQSQLSLITILVTTLRISLIWPQATVTAQRSLHHWKRDIEHRVRIYQGHRNAIDRIIASSVYPTREDSLVKGPVRVSSRGDVRFSDLFIPSGSLILSPAIASNAAQILAEKTRGYVSSKATELRAIQVQLDSIRQFLDEPTSQFIYKRPPSNGQHNSPRLISGARVFKQAQYVKFVDSPTISLNTINNTNVDRVIDDTYLRNTKFRVRDSQGRPYFEGRKTFRNTVFEQELESGCCGRLQPLDTSRLMLRSVNQQIRAPVLIQPGPHQAGSIHGAAYVRHLSTPRFYNKHIVLNSRLSSKKPLAPGDIGLMPSPPPENFIQLSNLINTRQLDHAELLKTIIFQSPVSIDEALLSQSYVDSRLVIGVNTLPGFFFDLSHDNYLLRYLAHSQLRGNNSGSADTIQHVSGKFYINGPANFASKVDAQSVNSIANIRQFLQESVVNINRRTIIHGPVQFNALPAMLNAPPYSPPGPNQMMAASISRAPQNVLIMRVANRLDVNLVNGMRVPNDIVVLSSPEAPADQNLRVALKPNELISVRGPRHFANRAIFEDFLTVNGTINDIPMPSGVIPLHLNDIINTAGYSNVWFMDGVSVRQLTTHSNQFDQINLGDVNGEASNLVMRSMLRDQPDGSSLITAQLRVVNLNLIQDGPNRGLLNGFRPQDVLEFSSPSPYDTIIHGTRTFLGPVEATDCVFQNVNHVANWTNHLIRIDRPNTVQTIHTRLSFASVPSQRVDASAVNIDRMDVEFNHDNDPVGHQTNWNFSPELYLLQQALMRNLANSTGGRYRVNQVRLIHPSGGQVNGIPLNDIVTLDKPFRFADKFTMVGKVEVTTTLQAGRIQSNYPIDAMDLVQFNKYRIPLVGDSQGPIKLNNLVLGEGNQALSVTCRLLNGTPFREFVSSIMSLTRPQDVYSNIKFTSPVSFNGPVITKSSLNSIKNFAQFADQIRRARYSFEDGLQCNSVVVRNQ